MTGPRERQELQAAKLCIQCRCPNPRKQVRCLSCTRKNTIYRRKLRQEKVPPSVVCPLCLEVGHQYKTCTLNADYWEGLPF